MENVLMDKITVNTLVNVFNKKNYVVFSDDTKNYNLNVFSVRNSIINTNTFNDVTGIFWKFEGVWNLVKYDSTVDPGYYYLENPMTSVGTKIKKPGQYRGAYSIGLHSGKYDCLKQSKDLDFYLDPDRNKLFNRDETKLFKGNIGANIHSTINGVVDIKTAVFDKNKKSTYVDKWSAACTVIASPYEFQQFMKLCYASAEIHGNSFTYTLLEETDF
jgi:hypothetical protein